MVYDLVVKGPRRRIMALTAAIAVEVFRFVHSPELGPFRLTLADRLLIERVFSL